MKDYDKNGESSYLQYWNVNNLYSWAMPQKLLVNNFEWIEETVQFNEDFMKIMLKMKNHHIYNIGMQIIYIVGQCHKSF